MRATYGHMRVTSAAFGVSSGEDGVHQYECAHNLSTQAVSLSVAVGHGVRASSVILVEGWLEALHDPRSADGSQALHYHVQQCPIQRYLPRQEQAERHSRIDVPSCEPSPCIPPIHEYPASRSQSTGNSSHPKGTQAAVKVPAIAYTTKASNRLH